MSMDARTNFEALEKAKKAPAPPPVKKVDVGRILEELEDAIDENLLFPDDASREEAKRAIREGFEAEE